MNDGEKSARLVIRDAKGAEVGSGLVDRPSRGFRLGLEIADGKARARLDDIVVAEGDLKPAEKAAPVVVSVARGPFAIERFAASGLPDAKALGAVFEAAAQLRAVMKKGLRGKSAKLIIGAFGKVPAGATFRGNRLTWNSNAAMSIVSIQRFKRPLFTATVSKVAAEKAEIVFWGPAPSKGASKPAFRLPLPAYPNEKRELVAFHHDKKIHCYIGGVRVHSIDATSANLQVGVDCGPGGVRIDGMVVRQQPAAK